MSARAPMPFFVVVPLALSSLVSCTNVTVAQLKAAPAKPSGCSLEIYSKQDEIKRPFESVCLLETKKNASEDKLAAVKASQSQACACGADALIVESAVTHADPWMMHNTKVTLRGIRYTDSTRVASAHHSTAHSPVSRQKVQALFGSLAVLPLAARGDTDPSISTVLDDVLIAAITNELPKDFRVIGRSDMDAILGLERMKEIAGCDDVTCTTEIAGALGVDAMLTGSLGKLGAEYILTLTLIDVREAKVLSRHSEKLGEEVAQFDARLTTALRRLLLIATS